MEAQPQVGERVGQQVTGRGQEHQSGVPVPGGAHRGRCNFYPDHPGPENPLMNGIGNLLLSLLPHARKGDQLGRWGGQYTIITTAVHYLDISLHTICISFVHYLNIITAMINRVTFHRIHVVFLVGFVA